MGANQSTTSITSLNDVVRKDEVFAKPYDENPIKQFISGRSRFCQRIPAGFQVELLRSSDYATSWLCKTSKRQGKWARFSGTDEELARTALEHAKFQAAKRRPLLKQISHSMSRRNGFNSQEEFDTVDEQWVWSPNNSQDNLQFQAVNCSICGNYISVSNPDFPLSDRIRCNCDHNYNYTENDSLDGLEEFKEYEEIV